jgi:Domain of unknown function (DUF4397)
MRNTIRSTRASGRVGMVVLLVATMVAMLLGPVGVAPAVAQDDLSIQTRVQVLHADPALDQVEVFINDDEVLDEFTYGQQSDWIDFQPGGARVTITADRAGFNYAVFDAVYPAPADNDYYLIVTDPLVMGGVFDTNPIPDRGARVRIVQASVALPAVTVTANEESQALARQLPYAATSVYTVVPAGTYDIDVTLADSGDVALTVPGLVLEGDTTYDLVLMGQPGDEDHPLELRPLSDTTRERATPTP